MDSIINKLFTSNDPLTFDESFALAHKCAQMLCNGETKNKDLARKITIHILDRWANIPNETYSIWTDIVEAIGFYPYLSKNSDSMVLTSFSDEVRTNTYLSHYLKSTFLHSEQKKLSDYLLSGKNVIASAPTSFGKSLLIEELVASLKYKNVVIIQPTLALLDETRIKLKKYQENYKIIVRTSQSVTTNKGNLFLLTAERVMEYDPLPRIDLLIIDEFYKLSLRRSDERADVLNNAFLKIMKSPDTKFYFLGPNIDNITEGFAQKYNAIFYKSNYSLVDCNVIDMSTNFDFALSQKRLDDQKFPILFTLLDKLRSEQTLIYCSSPARARRFAKHYLDHLIKLNIFSDRKFPLIEWINKNISSRWSFAKELGYGIAIHDGSLQKHISNSVIEYFNRGDLRCIFCTSTIIEGVNTSAKNVVLFDSKKGDKFIDYFDYSNIKGRSGRLMEHYIGNIYNFVPTPPPQSITIDIPFYEQDNQILTDEILINIPTEDVQGQVQERYNNLYSIDSHLMDIIKRNGTNVNGQMSIYYALERDVSSKYDLIAWSQLPNWDKLNYVLSLAENNLFNFHDKRGIFSVGQLAHFLNIYRGQKNIMAVVRDIYNGKISKIKNKNSERETQCLDNSIEEAFHIYRHWFQYTVPKSLRVIDSLQRYVCEKHRLKAGSYSYYVQQLENDFIPENLSILMEYGIPSNTVHTLEGVIPNDLDEDHVIGYIQQNKSRIYPSLLPYEIDRLEKSL